MKTCSRCGETKALTDFGVKRAASDGRKSQCYACRRVPPEQLVRRPWTPGEDTDLANLLENYTVEEIAEKLGRSVAAVTNRRFALRKMSGIKPQPSQPWTDADDAALLDLKQDRACTLKQIASWMGRTELSIINRLQLLKQRGASIPDGRARKEPFFVPRGIGILLAKSCVTCGALRNACYYVYKPHRGSYDAECRLCFNKRRQRMGQTPAQQNRELLQEITKPIAINEWKKYTQEDLELVGDPDKSELEVALTLGRSYHAICSERARREIGPYGKGPKNLRLGDSRWVINFPNALRALQEHFQKLGKAVPEELWEWNDEEMAT